MKVNFWFWFRAFAMTVSLIGTVTAMKHFSQFKSPRALGPTVNLCPTRVSAIKWTNGASITQEKLTWYRRNNGRMEELDPVAVEKWLGAHCAVPATVEKAARAGQPVVEIEFVSGPPQTLFSAGQSLYQWGQQVFRSPVLDQALSELLDLPVRLRPSR